ncbi:MAG: hypothetical protein IJA89_04465 [Clostridia bacterium]|nr:hypothetical protein [Clostridia bacterium]
MKQKYQKLELAVIQTESDVFLLLSGEKETDNCNIDPFEIGAFGALVDKGGM